MASSVSIAHTWAFSKLWCCQATHPSWWRQRASVLSLVCIPGFSSFRSSVDPTEQWTEHSSAPTVTPPYLLFHSQPCPTATVIYLPSSALDKLALRLGFWDTLWYGTAQQSRIVSISSLPLSDFGLDSTLPLTETAVSLQVMGMSQSLLDPSTCLGFQISPAQSLLWNRSNGFYNHLEMIIKLLSFVLLMSYIIVIDVNISNHPCISGIKPTWS